MPKLPIVGRVHGDCYAGGLGLAAVCDDAVGGRGVQLLPQRSEARAAASHHRAPYVVKAMGERAAPLVCHRRALRRGRARDGFRARCVAPDARWMPRSTRSSRRWYRQRADGGARLRSWCRTWPAAIDADLRADTAPASPTSAPATRAARHRLFPRQARAELARLNSMQPLDTAAPAIAAALGWASGLQLPRRLSHRHRRLSQLGQAAAGPEAAAAPGDAGARAASCLFVGSSPTRSPASTRCGI